MKLLTLLIALSAAAAVGDRRLVDFDRDGNGVAVANRFDGDIYSIEAVRYLRGGGTETRTHGDGYQETAKVVKMDDSGAAYIAGVRYWQGQRHMWALKYSASGSVEWEWSDDLRGCAAGDLDLSAAGDVWIGAHCRDGSQTAVRVARLNPRGSPLWTRMYQNESHDLEAVHADSSERISVATVGRGGAVRTTVFDARGSRIAEY